MKQKNYPIDYYYVFKPLLIPDEGSSSSGISPDNPQVLDVVDVDVQLFVGADLWRKYWSLLGGPSEEDSRRCTEVVVQGVVFAR